MNIDFIKDEKTLKILQDLIDLAGDNFNIPYDADTQPTDGVEKNEEILTQFDLVGGAKMKGMMPGQANPSMGTVIMTLTMILSPFLSAYNLLLPIMAIIKAIIEVLCCLMNPFCVIDALKRLFSKYIPAFISLFPPIGGIIIMKSIIKLIMAVAYYIQTEVVPTVQLMIRTAECVAVAIENRQREKAEACKDKLKTMVIILLNKVGILGPLKPIVEFIMDILALIAGLPCDGEKRSGFHNMFLFPVPSYDASLSDTSCCNEEQCPEELFNAPAGTGLLIRTFFGDSPPGWSWRLFPLTGQQNLQSLRRYHQDIKSQLDPQLDEPIAIASPIPSEEDCAHFRLRIMSPRGESFCVTDEDESTPTGSVSVPIAEITDENTIIVNNVRLDTYQGLVNYCIEPNYTQLVARNVLSIGCHPDISSAKAEMSAQFADIREKSGLDRLSEVSDFEREVEDIDAFLKSEVGRMDDLVNSVVDAVDEFFDRDADEYEQSIISDIYRDHPELRDVYGDYPKLADIYRDHPELRDVYGDPTNPLDLYGDNPNLILGTTRQRNLFFDDVYTNMDGIQDSMISRLGNEAERMQDYLNIMVSRFSDKVLSTFEVDKHVVKTGGEDKAIVSVTIRDLSGTPLLRDMPANTTYSVDLFTDFGTIQNQTLDSATGSVTAELVSAFPGTANVMAKVNSEFVVTAYGDSATVKIEQIRFVADAILPKRRLSSKSKARTGVVSEREPGGR